MNYIKQHFFSEGFPYQANTFNTDSSFFVAEKLWGPLRILSSSTGHLASFGNIYSIGNYKVLKTKLLEIALFTFEKNKYFFKQI